MSQTEQDEPWYDAEDIAEWSAVMETALSFEKARAKEIVANAESRRHRFNEAVRALEDPETRVQARADIAALVGVPRKPRPLPTQPDPPPMSPEELEAANKRRLDIIAEYKKIDSAMSAERIAAEEQLRRAKAERYTAGWDDAAAALHLERLREYRKKLSADHVITADPATWPVWPKEWGPM